MRRNELEPSPKAEDSSIDKARDEVPLVSAKKCFKFKQHGHDVNRSTLPHHSAVWQYSMEEGRLGTDNRASLVSSCQKEYNHITVGGSSIIYLDRMIKKERSPWLTDVPILGSHEGGNSSHGRVAHHER